MFYIFAGISKNPFIDNIYYSRDSEVQGIKEDCAMFFKSTTIYVLLLLMPSITLIANQVEEEPLLSVGYLEEEESDEIAGGDSRDSNIPMLFDKNQMRLSSQRERAMRRQGICCPPDTLYRNCVPCPRGNPTPDLNYDIENHRYRKIN